MVAEWVKEELETVDLGDKRRDRRLQMVLSELAERPTSSIPAACGGHAEMTAAYRLFENDAVAPEAILKPHAEKTRKRVSAQKVALLVQDTTEGDLTRPEQPVQGAGPLDGSSSRRGFFLHLLAAFTPDGIPLGALWHKTWARDEASLSIPKAEKCKQMRRAPIHEKESGRWLDGLREARAVAEQSPDTCCVCVADSEADIYELFAEPRGETNPVHWLVRLCHDRILSPSPEADSENTEQGIWEAVGAAPVLFTHKISVRGRKTKVTCDKRSRRQPREDREATVEVRSLAVTVRPPYRRGEKLPATTVNIVQAREINPPAGDVPVEWLLATTLPIITAEQVRTIIQYYCIRWMIEVFFRTLKSGCRVESRRFETLDRELRCVAVYLIVAWRVLYLCRLGRAYPNIDCEAVFEPSEWKAVWIAVKRKPLPKTPPGLQEMVRLVAQLGGYINRANRKDEPGPQTMWLGLQRMQDLAQAWRLFGPETRQKNQSPA